jgi:WD40 repeat protein
VSFVHHDLTTDDSKVLDIATGQITTIAGLPDGSRYYSGDRLRMLVILDYYHGLARLYDTGDSYNPIALADYSAGTPLTTAAVSNDGNMVAVQVLEEGSRSHTEVRLLNGSLDPLGSPLVTHIRNDGLDFKGGYLFVGTQDHRIPAWVREVQTHDILVFDLREK